MNTLFLIGGLLLILAGANGLTDGAASVAKRFRIPSIVIGLTIVAFGTSAPELTVSVSSALKGSADIAIGNVVGSNTFNTLMIVGCTALFAPIAITRNTLKREIPLCILSSIALLVCANDMLLDGSRENTLSTTDGLLMLCFFTIFLSYTFAIAKRDDKIKETEEENLRNKETAPRNGEEESLRSEKESLRNEEESFRNEEKALRGKEESLGSEKESLRNEEESFRSEEKALRSKEESLRSEEAEEIKSLPVWKSALYIIGGLAGLIIGGNFFVDGASGIARSLGVSESVIGLTLVAGGTSLPELATSIVAALKKNPEIAIGNAIGSNLFNIFFVLGCSASITPLHLTGITNFDLWVLVGSGILLWLFGVFFGKRTITRIEGSVLILCYVAYTAVLIHNI